jgi:hypothetical protein
MVHGKLVKYRQTPLELARKKLKAETKYYICVTGFKNPQTIIMVASTLKLWNTKAGLDKDLGLSGEGQSQ